MSQQYNFKINHAILFLSHAQAQLKGLSTNKALELTESIEQIKKTLENEKTLMIDVLAFLEKEIQTTDNPYKKLKLQIKYWSIVQTKNKENLRSQKPGEEQSKIQSVVAKTRNSLKDFHGKLNVMKIEKYSPVVVK